MSVMVISLLFLLIVDKGGRGVLAQVVPSWDTSQTTDGQVKEGDSFMLKCDFSNVLPTDSLYLKKRVSDETEVIVYSYGGGLKEGYGNFSDRYQTEVAPTPDGAGTASFTLVISDAIVEDGGNLTCASSTAYSTALKVAVSVAIESVIWREITTDGDISNNSPGQTITLTQGVNGGLVCIAEVKSNVDPEVSIKADGSDIDISSWSQTIQVNAEDVPELTDVYTYDTILHMKYFTDLPSPLLHGRTMRCESWTVDYSDVVKSTEVDVEVTFLPIFDCGYDGNKIYGMPGDDVTLNCSLLANPAPVSNEVYITWMEDGLVITMDNAESIPGFEFLYATEDERTGSFEVDFRLISVKEAYYDFNFIMHAKNEMGAVTHPIMLIKGTGPGSTSGAWRLFGSAVTMMVVLMLSIIPNTA